MGLILKKENSDVEIFNSKKLEYLQEERKVVVYDDNETERIFINYALGFDERYSPDDFEVYLFWRNSFATNDIYRIKLPDVSKNGETFDGYIGWFFPITALETDQHDYADNQHFHPYSTNAFKTLILSSHFVNEANKLFSNETSYSLSELFNENVQILIVYKESIKQYEKLSDSNFSINNYLVYLHSVGIFRLDKKYINKYFNDEISFLNSTLGAGNNINLVSISETFKKDSYIQELFSGLLNSQIHPLLKFHLLYQVIELSIEKVLKHEFITILNDFNQNQDVFNSKKKLNDLTKEGERISKLLGNYMPGVNQLLFEELKNACMSFLTTIQLMEPGQEITPAESLYKVRNTLFHNYRVVEKHNALEYLYQINELFENLCNKILNNFTHNI